METSNEDVVDGIVRRMTVRFALMLLAATIYQAVMLTIFLLLLAR